MARTLVRDRGGARGTEARLAKQRCGPEARVPRRFAQRGLTGFDNAEADAGRKPAYPGALRSTGSPVSTMPKQMWARGPRTQALCAARTHWFRQCRRRCGPEARVPRRFAQHGLTGIGNDYADAGKMPAYPGALRSTDAPVSTMSGRPCTPQAGKPTAGTRSVRQRRKVLGCGSRLPEGATPLRPPQGFQSFGRPQALRTAST